MSCMRPVTERRPQNADEAHQKHYRDDRRYRGGTLPQPRGHCEIYSPDATLCREF